MPPRRNRLGQFASNGNGQSPYGGLTDPMIGNALSVMAENAQRTLSTRLNEFFDPRRNINDECGYPETHQITDVDYQEFYDREPVAARVNDILPEESWQVQPTVFEDENVDNETKFEAAWKALDESLRGTSWYKQEEGSSVWEYLLRVDKLSGIGSFGVLLLGIDDGKDLREPLEGFDTDGKEFLEIQSRISRPSGNKAELIFLRVFSESLASPNRFEINPHNPRHGQPVTYSLSFNDHNQTNRNATTSQVTKTVDVHWSRVIHVADNLKSSEVFGVPRMQPVFNRLYDLKKIYAADGETYWRNAVLKMFFETHPQLGGDVEIDKAGFKDSMEQMMNGMQQWMTLSGMSVNSVAPAISDPTPHVDAQIEAICIKLGIPKRIFTGSERGNLASEQDDGTWNDRLRARQNFYLTPRVIVPFVDRLIALGVLPEPAEGYSVVWPDLDTVDAATQADVLLKRTQSQAAYVQGGVEAVMPPMDFYTREMGYSPADAEEILKGAVDAVEDEDTMTLPDEPEETPFIDPFEMEGMKQDGAQKLERIKQGGKPKVSNTEDTLELTVEQVANEFNLTPVEAAIAHSGYTKELAKRVEDLENERK